MNTRLRPKALLIAGPTASGKSAFALAAARALGGVIINADSMQVYRELRVLTARPTAAEEALFPHRLYGHVGVSEPYSVGRWLGEIDDALAEAWADRRLPIIVGGTGLYFKALLEGLSPVPPIPNEVRTRWREAGASWPVDKLYAELERRDPLTAHQLRPSDRQRLVRALEVLEATAKPLAVWQRVRGTPLLPADDVARVVISRDRQQLYERSARRFDKMLEEGALQEADQMLQLQLNPVLPAARVLGLAPLMAFLSHEIPRDTAINFAKRETRNYIKRQLTWLRRHMISWKCPDVQQMQIQVDKNFPIIDFLD